MPETGEGTLAQKTSRPRPEGLFSMALWQRRGIGGIAVEVLLRSPERSQ